MKLPRQREPQDDRDEGPRWEPIRRYGYETTLSPGEHVIFRVEEGHPIEPWVENAQARITRRSWAQRPLAVW